MKLGNLKRRVTLRQGNPKHIWKRYVLGMLMILILMSSSYLTTRHAARAAEHDAEIINMSGQQRMLSQRILHLANIYGGTRADPIAKELDAAVRLFEASHRQLISLDAMSEESRQVYFPKRSENSLDQMSRAFAFDVHLLLTSSDDKLASAIEQLNASGSDQLLQHLNMAVSSFESTAKKHSRNQQWLQKATLIAGILTLLLGGLLIVWPAQRNINVTLIRLQRQRSYLRAARDRNAAKNKTIEIAQTQIERDALHDPLTGLANSHYLDTELERRVHEASANQPLTIMQIDLDGFKHINDKLGHSAGEYVLKHAGETLRRLVGEDGFIARTSGDKFVILPDLSTQKSQVSELADKIIEALSKPVSYQDSLCHFGATIGIDTGSDGDQILAQANIALRQAKQQGPGIYLFFTTEMGAAVEQNQVMSDQIIEALEADEIIPHYQPLYDAKTRQIVAVEALARWQHPTRGLLPAASFIDLANDLKVTARIDEVILNQACWDAVTWAHGDLGIDRISVNISASRLSQPSFIEQLKSLMIERGQLSIELTETIHFETASDRVWTHIEELRDLEIGIELDDFGTGHASMASLMRLRPQRIKIARELIDPILTSETNRKLVATIIDLCHSMGTVTVAEGVETEAHAKVLTEMGCGLLQGYALAKPMSHSDLVTEINLARLRALPEKTAEPSETSARRTLAQ